jgi:dCMP deaminase
MKPKFVKLYSDIADRVSQMSHATRAKVGAVIVKDNTIISYGYNGMPHGWPNDCEYNGATRPEDRKSVV